MNRFAGEGGIWSALQREMLLTHLSFMDLFRPRGGGVTENVRNFVAFSGGLHFAIALRCMIVFGFQVSAGVLCAAHYGVAEARRRAFLLCSPPGSVHPSFPKPETSFCLDHLAIVVTPDTPFMAVSSAAAPLRCVTVEEAIGDLCDLELAADCDMELLWPAPPASTFQALMRRGADSVKLHVCRDVKATEALLVRCLPPDSPHDWRYLWGLRVSRP